MSPAHSERGRARTRRTATTKSGTATVGPATAGTATAGTAVTATAGTATAVSLSHGTTVASASAGSSEGRGVSTLRRSPRKRTPVSPSRDSSPKKKKTKSSSSSTTSSRKKGGADKASSKDLASQGPATRSGASKRKAAPSAAAGTAPGAVTAPPAGTAPTASTSGSQALRLKTPTKAALKSYYQSFTLRDPLMPHLEDDPLGGDPFDAYYADSGDEEIPCGQRDNLAAMFDLAGILETPVPAQVGELRAPLAPPLPPAAQTAPVAGPAPAIDLAMLVAALREAVPPPPLIIHPSHPPLSPMRNDRPGPVGGRLRSFAHLWPLVTSDKFVLETVTRGYRIEFTSKPPTTSKVWWTETPKNPSRREDLERGLQSMLDKKAIREIPVSPDTPGFYSPIFLVAKESGGWRPILNLKAFNKFIVPPSFRMETLRTVMDCLGEAAQQRRNTSEHLRDSSLSETWAISIDLRDAYFHVAVAPEHTRYLRLAYNGRAFEFLVLPFGLSTAPRVFTRIVRVIEAFLKIQGVDMHQYLDDWLMKNQSRSLVERHRDLTLFWVDKLGFLVNEGKSQLIPTQTPAFLGSTLDLLNMLVFPSERRILRASGLFAGENCPAGEDLAEVSRTLVQPPRVGPHGGSPHVADPADAPRPVDAGLRQPLRAHLSERGNPRRVRMVGVAGQPSGWSTLPASRSDHVDRDGCLQGGLGRPPRRLGGLRALVKSLGQATHQLARASSGLANPEAFPTSVAGHCCGCHFRQYHHGCLYQQGGRDSVPVSVPLGTGRLGMVQATRDLSCSQPPVGRQERPRGRPVQGEPPSYDGVDPPQCGDQCDISALAHTTCGPVRVGEEPQVTSVLLNPAVPVIE